MDEKPSPALGEFFDALQAEIGAPADVPRESPPPIGRTVSERWVNSGGCIRHVGTGESIVSPSGTDSWLCYRRPEDAALIADAPAMLELLREAETVLLSAASTMRGEFGSSSDPLELYGEGEMAAKIRRLLDKHGRG